MSSTIDTLRAALEPRAFPHDTPGAPIKAPLVQTPSDRLRDLLRDAGTKVIGLVPENEYHQLVIALFGELATLGDRVLCKLHGVEVEHKGTPLLGSLECLEEPKEKAEQSAGDKPKAEKKPKAAKQSA